MKKCGEVMTANPVCCLPSTAAATVAELMKDGTVGPIPVVENEESRKLVGIVTDRDLAWKIWATGRDPGSTQIAAVMTREVVVIGAEDDVQLALNAMAEHHWGGLPVVDHERRVLGIIAQTDVATQLPQT